MILDALMWSLRLYCYLQCWTCDCNGDDEHPDRYNDDKVPSLEELAKFQEGLEQKWANQRSVASDI